jgi:hypothetical protein
MTEQQFDPQSLGALTLAAEDQTGPLEAVLKDHGWTVWRLNGEGAGDAAEVFAQASRDLPSPFTSRNTADWTAFADSLWEAVHTSGSDESVLLWTGVDSLLDGSLADLVEGSVALVGLSRGLNSPANPSTRPKSFRSVLLGDGPNFPELAGL